MHENKTHVLENITHVLEKIMHLLKKIMHVLEKIMHVLENIMHVLENANQINCFGAEVATSLTRKATNGLLTSNCFMKTKCT